MQHPLPSKKNHAGNEAIEEVRKNEKRGRE
jgi:hypothetical protein